MEPSKSTDKLIALEAILSATPLDRVKEITIFWKDVEYMAVPFVHVEYYQKEAPKILSLTEEESI